MSEGDKGNKFNESFSVYQQRHCYVEIQRFADPLRLHRQDRCGEDLPVYRNDFETAMKQPIPQAWFRDYVPRESFVLLRHES